MKLPFSSSAGGEPRAIGDRVARDAAALHGGDGEEQVDVLALARVAAGVVLAHVAGALGERPVAADVPQPAAARDRGRR